MKSIQLPKENEKRLTTSTKLVVLITDLILLAAIFYREVHRTTLNIMEVLVEVRSLILPSYSSVRSVYFFPINTF